MSKHTPGPWKFGPLSGEILHGSYTVATMPNEYEDNAVDQWGSTQKALKGITSDARLIAAAPDLLAALECIAAWGEGAKLTAGNVRMIRAAIVKATGGDL